MRRGKHWACPRVLPREHARCIQTFKQKIFCGTSNYKVHESHFLAANWQKFIIVLEILQTSVSKFFLIIALLCQLFHLEKILGQIRNT